MSGNAADGKTVTAGEQVSRRVAPVGDAPAGCPGELRDTERRATGADRAPAALSISHLSFAYAGAVEPVLRDVSLELPAGAFALLVGGTGSGKSTLLSLIKPEIAPAGERSGAIRVFGRAVGGLSAAESAGTVGFVFQNPDNQIVCESVWHEMAFGLENLGVPQGEMRRLVAETSYFFGLEDWFRHDTDTLSGGRKQLLALAATLVMQPRLLLLDEPTSQLDPIAEKNFLHALFRVNRELGCTVVVATHAPRAMVEYATCAYRLVDGELREIADLQELCARDSLRGVDTGLAGADGADSIVGRTGGSASVPPSTPAASFSRAWFRYGCDDDWILRNLDLRVESGRLHALVGGNGCGKSTLLALMAGVRKLQRGALSVAADAKALLPQDPRALFAAETVEAELMEWSRDGSYSQREADDMRRYLGLKGCAALHPYDLSGGQQQLLALGKLLLLHPQLLLLDEPTKGLDARARRMVARVLRRLRGEGLTVVFATHDLDFVSQVADNVSMMFDGEIACTAPTDEFFRGNVYYRP